MSDTGVPAPEAVPQRPEVYGVFVDDINQPAASRMTYYEDPAFANRPDCIYERIRDRLRLKQDARFHEDGEGMATDIGAPPTYERANVLVSRNFRYLGGNGTHEYKFRYPKLTAAVEAKKQGQNAYTFDDRVGSELLRLRDELWKKYPDPVAGPPTEAGGGPAAPVTALPAGPEARPAAPKRARSCAPARRARGGT